MEQALPLISLASNIIAMAAAITTLADTALLHRHNRAVKQNQPHQEPQCEACPAKPARSP